MRRACQESAHWEEERAHQDYEDFVCSLRHAQHQERSRNHDYSEVEKEHPDLVLVIPEFSGELEREDRVDCHVEAL